MVEHLLNRTLAHTRPHTFSDGGGGQATEWRPVGTGTVRARVNQPTAVEREAGDQLSADLSYPIYLSPRAAVRRGDRLTDGHAVYEVLETYGPSVSIYLRADCRLRQSEGGP
ncbi:head-tail adaptor protein [Sphaerisporangium sp. NPDC049003]|uniref:phage head completion protein n=1 Tax=Sphaerisporangium sp. NPDC049003 TaxID=3364517 RepID=UPI0037128990